MFIWKSTFKFDENDVVILCVDFGSMCNDNHIICKSIKWRCRIYDRTRRETRQFCSGKSALTSLSVTFEYGIRWKYGGVSTPFKLPFTPPRNRGDVIFSLQFVSTCVCLSLCLSVSEQNSSRTDAPIWTQFLLNGYLQHLLRPYCNWWTSLILCFL